MKITRLAGSLWCALASILGAPPAAAQEQITSPAGFVPKSAQTFADPAGKSKTVSAADPLPVTCPNCGGGVTSGSGSLATSRTLYVATAAGTSYSLGDLLDHIVTSNPASTPNPGAVSANYWINLNTGALLASAPPAANIALVPTTVANSDFGADCLVVSGDQAYSIGSTQRCTMTSTGRIKMGLSSAGPIAPAAQPATQLASDLVACKYVATGVTFGDGWTGALSCDALGRLLFSGAITSADLGLKADAAWDFSAASPTLIAVEKANALKSQALAAAAGTPADAACASVSGSCSNIALGKASLTASNANAGYNAPYSGAVALTVGTAVSGANIGRAIATSCTVAGNVNLTLSGGSSITLQIPAGVLILPFAVTTVASSGTTATCSYYNLP